MITANIYRINGGKPLRGEVVVGGAKNAALPVLAAAALVGGVSVIENCPNISDIQTACDILVNIGCKVKREGNTITVDSTALNGRDIEMDLARRMRASINYAGALFGRTGYAKITLPGGCVIGGRPIGFHLDAFKALGAEIIGNEKTDEFIIVKAQKLAGAEIAFPTPSVGATENVMLAAALAEGTTVIKNAAREPEIIDLQNYLNACGADIAGAGSSTVIIKGVKELCGTRHTIIADRIVAGTFMCAAAATRGEVCVSGINYADILPLVECLDLNGAVTKQTETGVYVKAAEIPRSMGEVVTLPHPGFPKCNKG